MYCKYAGCDCIVPTQAENGCNDCHLKINKYFRSATDGMEFLIFYLQEKEIFPEIVSRLEKVKEEFTEINKDFLYGERQENI